MLIIFYISFHVLSNTDNFIPLIISIHQVFPDIKHLIRVISVDAKYYSTYLSIYAKFHSASVLSANAKFHSAYLETAPKEIWISEWFLFSQLLKGHYLKNCVRMNCLTWNPNRNNFLYCSSITKKFLPRIRIIRGMTFEFEYLREFEFVPYLKIFWVWKCNSFPGQALLFLRALGQQIVTAVVLTNA